MLILPGALPVAPTPEQAFAVQPAPSPVKTVTPVAQSAKTRNETGHQAGNQSGGQSGAILAPIPDPDKPTGPTPAFEANLLEAEREKLRAGPNLPDTEPTEAEAKKMPEQYAQAPSPEAHKVDIAV
ncbi:hypothetical protein [Profundibacter sp.]